ncbi:MAG: hypothetical protein O7A03_09050 [Alphaproteobacteria bacterium]|nr:hypothetical protein [Alphaproteobacteria bacterium]
MNLKSILRVGSVLVVAVSLVYVIWQLASADLWRHVAELGWPLAAAVAGSAVIYGAAGLLLTAAWTRILKAKVEVRFAEQLVVYGTSQIAKYAPGNVFFYLGRHVAGRQLGLSHASLAWAGLVEALGLLLAAGALALAGWGAGWMAGSIGNGSGGGIAHVLTLSAAIFLMICAGAAVWVGLGPLLTAVVRLPLVRQLPGETLEAVAAAGPGPALVPAYLTHVAFFAVSGTLIWLIAGFVSSLSVGAVFSVISVGAAAWILGFLVPGASAGIGVREAVLILGLTGLVGAEAAAIVAVAYRAATVGGDLLFFLLAVALRRRRRIGL